MNRLIVTALGMAGVIRYQRGHLNEEMLSPVSNGYSVLWSASHSEEIYNQVIIRHGPDPFYFKERFPKIWASSGSTHQSIRDLQVTTDLDDQIVFPQE